MVSLFVILVIYIPLGLVDEYGAAFSVLGTILFIAGAGVSYKLRYIFRRLSKEREHFLVFKKMHDKKMKENEAEGRAAEDEKLQEVMYEMEERASLSAERPTKLGIEPAGGRAKKKTSFQLSNGDVSGGGGGGGGGVKKKGRSKKAKKVEKDRPSLDFDRAAGRAAGTKAQDDEVPFIKQT
tara:strand:+ start:473 stop:1015 length:543 start_codon:yes stop_codon:yes gene_type:complete